MCAAEHARMIQADRLARPPSTDSQSRLKRTANGDRFYSSGIPFSGDRFSPTTPTAAPTAAIATAAPPSSSATSTVFTRLRFVNGQPPASALLVVQGVDRRLSGRIRPHLDKAEPTAPSRLPVDDHLWRFSPRQTGRTSLPGRHR